MKELLLEKGSDEFFTVLVMCIAMCILIFFLDAFTNVKKFGVTTPTPVGSMLVGIIVSTVVWLIGGVLWNCLGDLGNVLLFVVVSGILFYFVKRYRNPSWKIRLPTWKEIFGILCIVAAISEMAYFMYRHLILQTIALEMGAFVSIVIAMPIILLAFRYSPKWNYPRIGIMLMFTGLAVCIFTGGSPMHIWEAKVIGLSAIFAGIFIRNR